MSSKGTFWVIGALNFWGTVCLKSFLETKSTHNIYIPWNIPNFIWTVQWVLIMYISLYEDLEYFHHYTIKNDNIFLQVYWDFINKQNCIYLMCIQASQVTQMVKNLPAMRETCSWSLCWEDPLEEGMATHSIILAWRIPMDRGAWWATVHGVQRVRHD